MSLKRVVEAKLKEDTAVAVEGILKETSKAETPKVKKKDKVKGKDKSVTKLADTMDTPPWESRQMVAAKVIPFDSEKHPDVKPLKVGNESVLPHSVVTEVLSMSALTDLCADNKVDLVRLQELEYSVFSRGVTLSNVSGLLKELTFFHYATKQGDFFLTENCDLGELKIENDNTLVVADGVVSLHTKVEGVNVILAGSTNRFHTLMLTNSIVLLGSPATVDDKGGVVSFINKRSYWHNTLPFDVVKEMVLVDSCLVADYLTTDFLSLNKSVVINSLVYSGGNVTVKNSRIVNTMFYSKVVWVDSSAVNGCNFSSRRLTTLNNTVIRDQTLHTLDYNIRLTHPIGFTRVDNPLLPTLTLCTLGEEEVKLGVFTPGMGKPIVFNYADSKSTITEQLRDWVTITNVPVFTESEVMEVTEIVVSRLAVLRTIEHLNARNRQTDNTVKIATPKVPSDHLSLW